MNIKSDLLEIEKKKKQNRTQKHLLETIEKGFRLGFTGYKKRSESYD